MATEIRSLIDEGTARLARVADEPRREAEVLLGAALGRPRAWLLAHPEEAHPRLRGDRPLRGVHNASCARGAGRLPARREGVLVAAARGRSRRADPAARNRAAGRVRAGTPARRPALRRARPRDRQRCGRARHCGGAAARTDPRHRPVGGSRGHRPGQCRETRSHPARRGPRGGLVRPCGGPDASGSSSATRPTSPTTTRACRRRCGSTSRGRRCLPAPTASWPCARSSARRPVISSPGGWLLVEHGDTQGAAVRELFEAAGFGQVRTHRDLAGRERCTEGRRPGGESSSVFGDSIAGPSRSI